MTQSEYCNVEVLYIVEVEKFFQGGVISKTSDSYFDKVTSEV